jgi:hypothetical protein
MDIAEQSKVFNANFIKEEGQKTKTSNVRKILKSINPDESGQGYFVGWLSNILGENIKISKIGTDTYLLGYKQIQPNSILRNTNTTYSPKKVGIDSPENDDNLSICLGKTATTDGDVELINQIKNIKATHQEYIALQNQLELLMDELKEGKKERHEDRKQTREREEKMMAMIDNLNKTIQSLLVEINKIREDKEQNKIQKIKIKQNNQHITELQTKINELQAENIQFKRSLY